MDDRMKCAIGLVRKNGLVESIVCWRNGQVKDGVGKMLAEHYNTVQQIKLLFEMGDLESLASEPDESDGDFSKTVIHANIPRFLTERRLENCKYFYYFDEGETDAEWVFTHVDDENWSTPEMWHSVRDELDGVATKQREVTQFNEFQPGIWHITPDSFYEDYDDILIKADENGRGIGKTIEVTNFEGVDGITIPTQAIPLLIDRFSKIYNQYMEERK
jgi:hypothetical protein